MQRYARRGRPRLELGEQPVWIEQRKHRDVVRATHDAAHELEGVVRRLRMAQAGHIRIVRASELRHVLVGARQHMVLPHERQAGRLVVRVREARTRHLDEARGLRIRLVRVQPTAIVEQVRRQRALRRGRRVLDARERLDARVQRRDVALAEHALGERTRGAHALAARRFAVDAPQHTQRIERRRHRRRTQHGADVRRHERHHIARRARGGYRAGRARGQRFQARGPRGRRRVRWRAHRLGGVRSASAPRHDALKRRAMRALVLLRSLVHLRERVMRRIDPMLRDQRRSAIPQRLRVHVGHGHEQLQRRHAQRQRVHTRRRRELRHRTLGHKSHTIAGGIQPHGPRVLRPRLHRRPCLPQRRRRVEHAGRHVQGARIRIQDDGYVSGRHLRACICQRRPQTTSSGARLMHTRIVGPRRLHTRAQRHELRQRMIGHVRIRQAPNHRERHRRKLRRSSAARHERAHRQTKRVHPRHNILRRCAPALQRTQHRIHDQLGRASALRIGRPTVRTPPDAGVRRRRRATRVQRHRPRDRRRVHVHNERRNIRPLDSASRLDARKHILQRTHLGTPRRHTAVPFRHRVQRQTCWCPALISRAFACPTLLVGPMPTCVAAGASAAAPCPAHAACPLHEEALGARRVPVLCAGHVSL